MLQVTSLRYHPDPTPSVLSLQVYLLHPLNPCEPLPEHQAADGEGGSDASGVGEETRREGVAAAADSH